MLETVSQVKLAHLDVVRGEALHFPVLGRKINQVEDLQQIHQGSKGHLIAVQLAAVEVENHLVQDSLRVGHLHAAGLALHKIIVVGEHGAEVLRSHAENRLVDGNISVSPDYLDIPELGISQMTNNVFGDSNFLINQHRGMVFSANMCRIVTGDWSVETGLDSD